MTEQELQLDVQIGEACEIDPAAGPIAARDNTGAEQDVLLYINAWCGDCRRAVRFLDEHDIAYRTIDLDEAPEAVQIVEALNRGNRSVPTILVDGEHVATEPSDGELAAIFGVKQPSSGLLSRLRR